MKLWRNRTWVLLLLCMPLYLPATSLQEMEAFCQAQSPTGEPACHLHPCPCSPDEVTLNRFQPGPEGKALCACRSALVERQKTRHKAVEICDKYRQKRHQTCFVSSGDCPRGFDAIESFSDRNDNRFSACRDSRHQQTALVSSKPYLPSEPELLSQYKTLISRLEAEQTGTPLSLPLQTRQTLSGSFPSQTLRLSLIRTQALKQGCFTDCNRVFCADDGRVERWTDTQAPLINRDLLHQLVHAVHCTREGGREGFVKHWFQHLPDNVHESLQTNKPIDAEQIHFAMYMETHANHRADALCRHLTACEETSGR